ncbi:unnamed protein product [Caenorhabditis bovis]|uniref:maleylacetoacetate isomerase n=1 Tax=Caenorhabditis bovis TaxID=2654633 RepID=A0A8S1F3E7_9PELO|nr:unnamed protein product [Caenorhabditis bovis]
MALAYKGIDYEYRAINILSQDSKDDPEFVKYNPAKLVPVFVNNDGQAISESLAIIDYLEDVYPENPLYPKDPLQKAHAKTIFLEIACGIQPLQTITLQGILDQKCPGYGAQFAAESITKGLRVVEELLKKHSGKYAVGDSISVADLAIPSIVFNARRLKVDLKPFPILSKVEANICALDVFKKAAPEAQPDAE